MYKRNVTALTIALSVLVLFIISGLTFTAHKLSQIDLPEELEVVSFDSLRPDTLYAWRDRSGVIRFEMRNYNRKAK